MASADENSPATPISRVPPPYPSACEGVSANESEEFRVKIGYNVSRDGEPENIAVLQSDHPCFEEVAVAAVRQWRFEPRRKDGVRVREGDLETTIVFQLSEPTKTEYFDAKPLIRVPPIYPSKCVRLARKEEAVVVGYDVNEFGRTENVRVKDTTLPCLNSSSIQSVKKWKFSPAVQNEIAIPRKDLETVITYRLTTSSKASIRRAVARRLNDVNNMLKKNKSLDDVFKALEEIEEKYKDSFSVQEYAAFYRIRGAARIEARNYRGALDDLRLSQRFTTSAASAEAVYETIRELEAAIVQQEANERAKKKEKDGAETVE